MDKGIPVEFKRAVLAKVLDSPTFARAEQLRQLLQWLGHKALEGGATPSEYEVGRYALRRPENFDPQTDSLVRKEMSRLRTKLREYYAAEGFADSVRLRCDDGYRLRFDGSRTTDQTSSESPAIPGLLVLPLYVEPGLDNWAGILYDELLAQIATLEEIRLIALTTARRYAGQAGDVREFAVQSGADLVVEGSVRRRDSTQSVILWLVDGVTGRAGNPCRLYGTNADEMAGQAAAWLLRCRRES